jgi:hypothetical protein
MAAPTAAPTAAPADPDPLGGLASKQARSQVALAPSDEVRREWDDCPRRSPRWRSPLR